VEETARHREGSIALVRRALGPPAGLPGKIARLARALAGYARTHELDRRLARLAEQGQIRAIPSRIQLIVGSADMLRFWISPAAAEYYRDQGIDYGFHQLLRLLEEPASLIDPVGFFTTRDGVIGHLMQVVHANPVYDLQLLEMFDDGLDQLERQIGEVLDGSHPRAGAIGAIVEEPGYHAQLLAFVRAWRKDRNTPPLLRKNVAERVEWRAVERTFGSLTSAMAYFAKLPRDPIGAARHLLTVKEFPLELAEP
jgi:hypothetical protein